MSYCRITGKSRALPKPNYFPLLPPISPADAKRFCRITGKAYGLPTHHYIPVILTTLTNLSKCKITNYSDKLNPHHFQPDISYGKRKHVVLADYRYIFPVLDGNDDSQKGLLDILNTKNVLDDSKYVYKVDEKRCSLVFSAKLEAAVRDGDVRDVMLAKNCESVLLKMRQGKQVSVDLMDYPDELEELYEGEGPSYKTLLEREQEEEMLKRKKPKRLSNLSQRAKIFEEKERKQEIEMEEYEEQVHRSVKHKKLNGLKRSSKGQIFQENEMCEIKTSAMEIRNELHLESHDYQDIVKPIIESWDWERYENEVLNKEYKPVTKKIPKAIKIEPNQIAAKEIQVPVEKIANTTGFDCAPCIGELTPILEQPDSNVINEIKNLPIEKLEPLLDLKNKIISNSELAESIPSSTDVTDVVENIKKGKFEMISGVPGLTLNISAAKKLFVTGQQIQTPVGEVFVPGQTVSTPQGPLYLPGLTVQTSDGPSFIPGCILTTKEKPESPVFVAGQIVDDKFIPGQSLHQKFTEGQTVLTSDGMKFVPGVVDEIKGKFVPGQQVITPEGLTFMPGQTATIDGVDKFIPGQNVFIEDKGWEFVPGQIIAQNGSAEFIAGKTVTTSEGSKFIPGQYVEDVFVPGITRESDKGLEFIPGLNVETRQGPKFIEGFIVSAGDSEIFMPGKATSTSDGKIDFAIAKTVDEVIFNEPAKMGYVVDMNTTEVSEQSLSVYGLMVQTQHGIEFYPEKIEIDHLPPGKRVPGKLIRQGVETKFVPGIMENGGFIPGQVVWTEKGEQFIPGQVIETSDGLKFVPGQVIVTKNDSKFVPGQTVDTPDGPRFIPGQIVHTKAGPTFIPGQVIYTEEEGERFVPGQVVDTEDGPRFVPGRVVETDDKVTFIPGQIVQTAEGPKFVAPDLTHSDDGDQEFSVQSFLITPEELALLKPTHTWTSSSAKGELSIDSTMLRQLSEAGMTIGRQIEASAVDIVLQSTKNSQSVRQLMEKFGIQPEYLEKFMEFFKAVESIASCMVSKDHSTAAKILLNGFSAHCNSIQNGHHQITENDIDEKSALIDAVISTVLTATAALNENDKKPQMSLFELLTQHFSEQIERLDVKQLPQLISDTSIRNTVMSSVQKVVENSRKANLKAELIQLSNKQITDEGQLITKMSALIEDTDLHEAFHVLTEQNPKILYKILNVMKTENESSCWTEESVPDLVQNVIVKAVNECSEIELKTIFTVDKNQHTIRNLLVESLAVSRALGLTEVANVVDEILQGRKCVGQIFDSPKSVEVMKRILIMKKLSKTNHEMHESFELLVRDPYEARKDPNIRRLIRQSGIVTIMPETKVPLCNSSDVPISFLYNNNDLAVEDFLLRRQTRNRGALLIVKPGYQAVVPRDRSRDVLTGKCAFTVLDENGIHHFEPLHVFSALKLNTPLKCHRFSMYLCDFAGEDNESLSSSNPSIYSYNSDVDKKLIDGVKSMSNGYLDAKLFPEESGKLIAARQIVRHMLRGGKVII